MKVFFDQIINCSILVGVLNKRMLTSLIETVSKLTLKNESSSPSPYNIHFDQTPYA